MRAVIKLLGKGKRGVGVDIVHNGEYVRKRLFYDLKAKPAAHTFKVADIAEQSPCRLFTSGQNERTGVGNFLSDPQQVQQVNKLPAVSDRRRCRRR